MEVRPEPVLSSGSCGGHRRGRHPPLPERDHGTRSPSSAARRRPDAVRRSSTTCSQTLPSPGAGPHRADGPQWTPTSRMRCDQRAGPCRGRARAHLRAVLPLLRPTSGGPGGRGSACSLFASCGGDGRDVTAEPVRPRGLRFVIRLPLDPAHAVDARPSRPTEPPRSRSPPRAEDPPRAARRCNRAASAACPMPSPCPTRGRPYGGSSGGLPAARLGGPVMDDLKKRLSRRRGVREGSLAQARRRGSRRQGREPRRRHPQGARQPR